MEYYSTIIVLNTTPDKVFSALTKEIRFWWTILFEGRADRPADKFTIRFGKQIFKTMEVKEVSSGKKVVWHVTDALIALSELQNQKEWVSTTIVWEIVSGENNTGLVLTHIGLSPEVECYDLCTGGWTQFLISLKQYLETGRGTPYKA